MQQRRSKDGICEVDYVDALRVEAARSALPDESALRTAAQATKALTHPARLKVLMALEGRELCVCDLSQVLGLSMSGTSQHLKELRRLGAIDFRSEGKLVYYTLADRFLLKTAKAMIKKFAADPAGKMRTG